jgi:hypothetical protein
MPNTWQMYDLVYTLTTTSVLNSVSAAIFHDHSCHLSIAKLVTIYPPGIPGIVFLDPYLL